MGYWARASLVASVLLTASSASAGGGSAVAASDHVDGAAIVRGAGRFRAEGSHDWRTTSTADILTAGVTVQAADDQPLEMTLPDGVTVTLEPNALVRWMPGGKLPSETNHWTHGYHLVLEDGELEVRMPPTPKGTHAFLVSTRDGTLTDWRGQLHVRVHDDATAAAIYEGALVVGSNGQGFAVYDGAGILLRRGVNPDKSRTIPAPPTWNNETSSLALVPSEAVPEVTLRWAPVANVAEYRVEVALDPTMVRVVQRTTTRDTTVHASVPLGVPRAWVHVRAVGPEGIVGAWSAARPIRTARYDLPEGAFVARDGVVVVPSGSGVPVHGSDGLEVAYENVTNPGSPRSFAIPLYWGKLSVPLHVTDDAPMRIAHVRDPAIGAEARIVLARRQLVADVDLSPKSARWPNDPIDVHVEVRDPSGRIDASGEAVSVDATLGLTPLPVAWQRHGTVWDGRITPRLIGGNSIVRVTVRDARGDEIGSGFLELASVGD